MGSRSNFIFKVACNRKREGFDEPATLNYILCKYANIEKSKVNSLVSSAYSNNTQNSKLEHYEMDTTEAQPFSEPSPSMVWNVFDLIKRNQQEPSYNFIWNGIKESSFGYVYGPPKVGKTIMCENLGMAIAAGHDSYLGIKIDQTKKRKVLFIGMEEFWRNRAERNQKQLEVLGDIDPDNYPYLVVDENFPGRFLTKEDWAKLDKIISENKPDIVFIDSMTRTVIGEIEDSSTSRDASFRLRELVRKYEIALIMVHHTTKLHGNPLDIDKLAGSRVIAQEADFMYGINKEDNKRYLKEVATRYKSEDENVVDFQINENLWLEKIGESQERVINDDMRRNPMNEQLVLSKILQCTSDENPKVETKKIIEAFKGSFVESEVYRYMKNLEANRKIVRGHGFVSRV